MYKFGSVVALFLGFALFGGAFMGLIALIPAGLPRDVTVCSIGVVFSGAFLYLLLARLKNLYAGRGNFWVEAAMATANLALLLSAFAVIYKIYGTGEAGAGGGTASFIADTSHSPEQKVKTFGEALYYSIVTFTTLGYGDMQPRGILRFMACLETFVGYLVLGILASTVSDFVQQWAKREVSDDGGDLGDGLVGDD